MTTPAPDKRPRKPGGPPRRKWRSRRPEEDKRKTAPRKKAYQIVVNRADCWLDQDTPVKVAERLQRRLRRSGWDCYLETADSWEIFEGLVAQAVGKRPFAVIIFGGDGSVRFAAARVFLTRGLLGIVPCGQYNNIFHSLYGHLDPEEALEIIWAGYQSRIDAARANGTFFLGSLVTGLIPAMLERLGGRKLPKLAMGWSKLAGKAMEDTVPRKVAVKVDSYSFDAQPVVLNIHLLPRLLSLRFAPAAVPDDGRMVLVYDRNVTRETIVRYIRDLKHDRYQYNDGLQMLRGKRIIISPAEGRVWLMDGEPVEFSGQEIVVEVIPQAVRVFARELRM